jgi:hypothetical protein
MQTATVKNIDWNNQEARELKVTISAKNTWFIEEPKGMGSPMIVNSAPLIEGLNYVLEFGHNAVNAMKANENFGDMAVELRALRNGIKNSDLAARARQFLSSLDYDTLTDFQAKCALLLEKELK